MNDTQETPTTGDLALTNIQFEGKFYTFHLESVTRGEMEIPSEVLTIPATMTPVVQYMWVHVNIKTGRKWKVPVIVDDSDGQAGNYTIDQVIKMTQRFTEAEGMTPAKAKNIRECIAYIAGETNERPTGAYPKHGTVSEQFSESRGASFLVTDTHPDTGTTFYRFTYSGLDETGAFIWTHRSLYTDREWVVRLTEASTDDPQDHVAFMRRAIEHSFTVKQYGLQLHKYLTGVSNTPPSTTQVQAPSNADVDANT